MYLLSTKVNQVMISWRMWQFHVHLDLRVTPRQSNVQMWTNGQVQHLFVQVSTLYGILVLDLKIKLISKSALFNRKYQCIIAAWEKAKWPCHVIMALAVTMWQHGVFM